MEGMVNMRTFRDISEDEYFYLIVIYATDGFLEDVVIDTYSRPVRSIDNIWESSSFGEENGCEDIHAEWYADRDLCIERLGDLLREFSEKNGCAISTVKEYLKWEWLI
jgi:hypothetical protein